MDSFDNYVSADLTEKHLAIGAGATINAAGGRRASSCARLGTIAQAIISRGFTVSGNTVIMGFAYKTNLINSGSSIVRILSTGTAQITLGLDASGFIRAFRGDHSGTLLGTAIIGAIGVGVFNYIELKSVIAPATGGSVIVRINGLEVLNVPSVNTSNTGGSVWNGFQFGNNGGTGTVVTWDYDDLYLLDGSGIAPWNDFLGDVRVDARNSTAPGATTGFTAVPAVPNWQNVDDAAPNDDTDYNTAPTAGLTDTFVFQDAPVVGAVLFGVQHCIQAKKADAGIGTIAPVIRHGGVDNVGASQTLGTNYAYTLAINQTNPGTGLAWTEADFNAAEFGYKRVT